MSLAIRYTVPQTQSNVQDELDWCNNQGWQHIVDWRWFHDKSDVTSIVARVQFHFEDPKHAHWFLLRWGGETIGEV
jgi:hypothetical protein